MTGRVVDVHGGRAKVELGEGVVAESNIGAPAKAQESKEAEPAKGDISSLTAMLSAKWKQGGSTEPGAATTETKAGQIRNFRIVRLDAAKKKIELEIVAGTA